MFEYKKVEIKNTTIYIIRYAPYPMEDFLYLLNDSEAKRFHEFSSIKRKYEYLSTRILKEQLFPGTTIEYDCQGAPFIAGKPHISISHSSGCSAIAVSEEHILGLDVEPPGEKAKRLYSKFLNGDECRFLDTKNELLMTRAWSCKEALLKLCRRKGLIFKRDLIIHSYDDHEIFTCSILKDEQLFSVHLTSKLIDQMILTINHSDLILKHES